MRKYRYMVVRHPHSVASNTRIVNGLFENHLPIHELLHEYHWSRINDEFVLVQGEYSVGHFKMLSENAHTWLLPSIGSAHILAKHGNTRGKEEHSRALHSRYNLPVGAAMPDLLDAIEEQEGPLFSPIR